MRFSFIALVFILFISGVNAQMGVFKNITPDPVPNPLTDGVTYTFTMEYDNTSLSGIEWVFQTNPIEFPSGGAVVGPVNLFGNEISFTITPDSDGGVPLAFTFEASDGSSNGWAIFSYAEASLPVVISNFDASLERKNVELHWSTDIELNSHKFEIQRAFDENEFVKIAEIEAKGNDLVGADYSFIDYNISEFNAEDVYYRLKQIDQDGKYAYSDRVVVSLGRFQENVFEIGEIHRVGSNEFLIELNSKIDHTAFIQVANSGGQHILNQIKSVMEGTNRIGLAFKQDMPEGVYVITVRSNYTVISEKVML